MESLRQRPPITVSKSDFTLIQRNRLQIIQALRRRMTDISLQPVERIIAKAQLETFLAITDNKLTD